MHIIVVIVAIAAVVTSAGSLDGTECTSPSECSSGSCVGAYCCASPSCDVRQTCATGQCKTNIGSKRAVTCSTDQIGFECSKVNDGLLGTRWGSVYTVNNGPQTVTIDLGNLFPITDVIVRWEAAYAREFTIGTSIDGTAYTVQYTQSDGKGGNEKAVFSITTRYVKLTMTVPTSVVSEGYSIYEVEIYGKGTKTPTPTPTTTNTPTGSATSTSSVTSTATGSATGSVSPTNSVTSTATGSATGSVSPTSSLTSTATGCPFCPRPQCKAVRCPSGKCEYTNVAGVCIFDDGTKGTCSNGLCIDPCKAMSCAATGECEVATCVRSSTEVKAECQYVPRVSGSVCMYVQNTAYTCQGSTTLACEDPCASVTCPSTQCNPRKCENGVCVNDQVAYEAVRACSEAGTCPCSLGGGLNGVCSGLSCQDTRLVSNREYQNPAAIVSVSSVQTTKVMAPPGTPQLVFMPRGTTKLSLTLSTLAISVVSVRVVTNQFIVGPGDWKRPTLDITIIDTANLKSLASILCALEISDTVGVLSTMTFTIVLVQLPKTLESAVFLDDASGAPLSSDLYPSGMSVRITLPTFEVTDGVGYRYLLINNAGEITHFWPSNSPSIVTAQMKPGVRFVNQLFFLVAEDSLQQRSVCTIQSASLCIFSLSVDAPVKVLDTLVTSDSSYGDLDQAMKYLETSPTQVTATEAQKLGEVLNIVVNKPDITDEDAVSVYNRVLSYGEKLAKKAARQLSVQQGTSPCSSSDDNTVDILLLAALSDKSMFSRRSNNRRCRRRRSGGRVSTVGFSGGSGYGGGGYYASKFRAETEMEALLPLIYLSGNYAGSSNPCRRGASNTNDNIIPLLLVTGAFGCLNAGKAAIQAAKTAVQEQISSLASMYINMDGEQQSPDSTCFKLCTIMNPKFGGAGGTCGVGVTNSALKLSDNYQLQVITYFESCSQTAQYPNSQTSSRTSYAIYVSKVINDLEDGCPFMKDLVKASSKFPVAATDGIVLPLSPGPDEECVQVVDGALVVLGTLNGQCVSPTFEGHIVFLRKKIPTSSSPPAGLFDETQPTVATGTPSTPTSSSALPIALGVGLGVGGVLVLAVIAIGLVYKAGGQPASSAAQQMDYWDAMRKPVNGAPPGTPVAGPMQTPV